MRAQDIEGIEITQEKVVVHLKDGTSERVLLSECAICPYLEVYCGGESFYSRCPRTPEFNT